MQKTVTLNLYLGWYKSERFSFCDDYFAEFFTLGGARVVELRVSDRKPRDKNYYELTRRNRWWYLTDSPSDLEDDSPHSLRFDGYLTREFPKAEKVYVSAYI